MWWVWVDFTLKAEVLPISMSRFVLYAPSARREFDNLEQAICAGRIALEDLAVERMQKKQGLPNRCFSFPKKERPWTPVSERSIWPPNFDCGGFGTDTGLNSYNIPKYQADDCPAEKEVDNSPDGQKGAKRDGQFHITVTDDHLRQPHCRAHRRCRRKL